MKEAAFSGVLYDRSRRLTADRKWHRIPMFYRMNDMGLNGAYAASSLACRQAAGEAHFELGVKGEI